MRVYKVVIDYRITVRVKALNIDDAMMKVSKMQLGFKVTAAQLVS